MKPRFPVPGDETSIWARNEVGSESRKEVAESLERESKLAQSSFLCHSSICSCLGSRLARAATY
jgi:hypothetical protein